MQLNIGLVLFNLFLPAFPLDGGRILADLLLLRGVSPETAAKVTAGLATLLGCGVVGIGVWRTLASSVASVLTIAVGLWMLYGGWWPVLGAKEGRVPGCWQPHVPLTAAALLPRPTPCLPRSHAAAVGVHPRRHGAPAPAVPRCGGRRGRQWRRRLGAGAGGGRRQRVPALRRGGQRLSVY